MKVREDGPRLVADRNRDATWNCVRKFGRCQNSAHRTISLKPSQKSTVLQEYKLVRVGIAKEPKRLKISVAPDCHSGCIFHFA